MNTFDVIMNRRSHRAYETTPLTEAETEQLVKAALASPTARNLQSWHYTFVTDQVLLQKIHDTAAANMGYGASPRFADSGFQMFYHAPMVVFISGDAANGWSGVDAGIAVQNIALAAEDMGLGSVILGMPKAAFRGEEGEAFAKALQFPEGHEFQIAIAVGRPTDTKDPHPISDGKVSFVG